MKTAITLLTCDRPELVEQSIKPLLDSAIAGHHHLFISDGSTKPANETRILELGHPTAFAECNIRGGAGAAIVYALTRMLNHEENYDVVGLVESDVLLPVGWFAPTYELFSRGLDAGLEVGAVSARCFADRVLFQRDGYAVCHNLGAGMVLLTREAATLICNNFRTAWTADNRRIFGQLAGFDIAAFWAFRANEHPLTADWHWDAVLAAHGLASLALTPSPVEMIGQSASLEEQGLQLVKEPAELPRDKFLLDYVDRLAAVRSGNLQIGVETQFWHEPGGGTWTYFPHQMHMLGGKYEGDWRLVERRGWGTWAYEAGTTDGFEAYSDAPGACPRLTVPAFGAVSILVSGGKHGGKVEVKDATSGFMARPELLPEGEGGQVLAIPVPGGMTQRDIRVTAMTPGVIFYGLQARDKQPFLPDVGFDHSHLPGA